MSQGDQKAHKSAIENLELATFSKQAHNEECSQQDWIRIQIDVFSGFALLRKSPSKFWDTRILATNI